MTYNVFSGTLNPTQFTSLHVAATCTHRLAGVTRPSTAFTSIRWQTGFYNFTFNQKKRNIFRMWPWTCDLRTWPRYGPGELYQSKYLGQRQTVISVDRKLWSENTHKASRLQCSNYYATSHYSRRRGLLLQTEQRGLSVCLSVTVPQWALQKLLNPSKCRLHWGLR